MVASYFFWIFFTLYVASLFFSCGELFFTRFFVWQAVFDPIFRVWLAVLGMIFHNIEYRTANRIPYYCENRISAAYRMSENRFTNFGLVLQSSSANMLIMLMRAHTMDYHCICSLPYCLINSAPCAAPYLCRVCNYHLKHCTLELFLMWRAKSVLVSCG